MRVVTNDKLIERNKKTAQILFFVSIGLLIASFFFSNTLEENADVAFYFQCLMIPALLGLVIVSVRMTNQWVRQPTPWDSIREGLKGMSGDTNLYNFVMPANHVVISPNGIFAITTRFQDRPQAVKDDKWRSNTGILTYMRQEQLGNPTHDALLNAAKTEVFLRELLNDETIKVQPLIVFTHPNADVTVEGDNSVPVLYANADKKKNSLKNYLRDIKKANYPTLTKEQIAELDDFLLFED